MQELEFELSLTALEKPNSQDQAAIATVTITAGQNSEAYDFLLEAPGGNFAQGRESIYTNCLVKRHICLI